MSVSIYRRHRKECEGGHPEDSRSSELDEGRRGWKKCRCLIHVSGTLGRKFSRKQTGKSKWSEAKVVAEIWEKANAWDGQPTSQPLKSEAPRLTLRAAISTFLALREGAAI